MANETSFTANIKGVQSLIESGTNKSQSFENIENEGVVGEKLDVLDLEFGSVLEAFSSMFETELLF